MENEIYTTQQDLANLLGVTVRTIQNWAAKGHIERSPDGRVGLRSGVKHQISCLRQQYEQKAKKLAAHGIKIKPWEKLDF